MVSKAREQFEFLAAQFEAIEHNLSNCQDPERRWELLREMLHVIVELDRFVSTDLSWLDSTLASTASTSRPLMKAAHQ